MQEVFVSGPSRCGLPSEEWLAKRVFGRGRRVKESLVVLIDARVSIVV